MIPNPPQARTIA